MFTKTFGCNLRKAAGLDAKRHYVLHHSLLHRLTLHHHGLGWCHYYSGFVSSGKEIDQDSTDYNWDTAVT